MASVRSQPKPSKRRTARFTRSQLQHNLQLLDAAFAVPLLPPTLPPSPPASRSPSPLPSSSKRKLPKDATSASDPSKRPRASLQHVDVHHHQDPPRVAADGDAQPVASTSATATVPAVPAAPAVLATAPTPGGPEPASFPHRRGKPSAADFTRFHERYSSHGKYFKYSAEIRGQAAGASQDPSIQRKLVPPPAPGTPYAVHAQLFSRIEAVDALLNFTYAMWCKDMVENKCHHALWDTIDQFLKWVRSRWETAETRGDAQRAFIGVIRMVEAYIYARKATFMNISNGKRFSELDKVVKPPPPATDPTASISPATSLGGSSQHSVPNASPPSGPCPSPMASASSSSSRPLAPASLPPSSHQPPSTLPTPHPSGILIPRDLYESLQASHNCNTRAARALAGASLYLNLGTLARHFPRTSARVLSAQLRQDEEFEVDFEQDACSRADGVQPSGDPGPGPGEGQLVWPGPLNALGGEGIAWVCLLGRAMVREMAFPLGYRGLESIVRKDAGPR